MRHAILSASPRLSILIPLLGGSDKVTQISNLNAACVCACMVLVGVSSTRFQQQVSHGGGDSTPATGSMIRQRLVAVLLGFRVV